MKKDYQTDYKKFGGKVYASDFDTTYPNGRIAERIACDIKFDEECRKNGANRINRN